MPLLPQARQHLCLPFPTYTGFETLLTQGTKTHLMPRGEVQRAKNIPYTYHHLLYLSQQKLLY